MQPQLFFTKEKRYDCRLMFGEMFVRYAENDRFQFVNIPYVGGRLGMAVFLPRDLDIDALNLDADLFATTLKSGKHCNVDLSLPKWRTESGFGRTESGFGLKEPLTDLGLGVAFTPQADFSGITNDKIYISAAVHKAFVDVTETGTEAAAATVVSYECPSAFSGRKPVFRADRPFVYVIHDDGNPLFVGRLCKP